MRKLVTITAGIFMGSISCFSSTHFDNDVDKTKVYDADKNAQVVQILDLSEFNALKVMIPAEVFVHQGETQKIVVTSPTDISEILNQSVNNNKWKISMGVRNIDVISNKMKKSEIKITKNKITLINYKITIDITIPHLEEVIVSGSGDIEIDDFVNEKSLKLDANGNGDISLNSFSGLDDLYIVVSGNGDVNLNHDLHLTNMDIDVSGNGNVKMIGDMDFEMINHNVSDQSNLNLSSDLHLTKMDIDISGNGDVSLDNTIKLNQADIEISGNGRLRMRKENSEVSNLKMEISGSGDCHCFGLMSNVGEVSVSGIGSAEVYANESLTLNVSGMGDVAYKGNPETLKSRVSGLGDVHSK